MSDAPKPASEEVECERCEGTGLIWDETACGDPEHCSPTYQCHVCNGTGVVS